MPFNAQIRLVLMVRKQVRGETLIDAAASAQDLKMDDLMKGNLLKCEVCDWGMYVATVEEDGQYNTD